MDALYQLVRVCMTRIEIQPCKPVTVKDSSIGGGGGGVWKQCFVIFCCTNFFFVVVVVHLEALRLLVEPPVCGNSSTVFCNR